MKRGKLTQNDIQFILIAILVFFSGGAMLFFGIKRDYYTETDPDGKQSYPTAVPTSRLYPSLNDFVRGLRVSLNNCGFKRTGSTDNEFEYAVSCGEIEDYGKLILSTDSSGQVKWVELRLRFFYYDGTTTDDEIAKQINKKCRERMSVNLELLSDFFYYSAEKFDTKKALSNADKSILIDKIAEACKDRTPFSKKSSGISVGLYTVESDSASAILGVVVGVS